MTSTQIIMTCFDITSLLYQRKHYTFDSRSISMAKSKFWKRFAKPFTGCYKFVRRLGGCFPDVKDDVKTDVEAVSGSSSAVSCLSYPPYLDFYDRAHLSVREMRPRSALIGHVCKYFGQYKLHYST